MSNVISMAPYTAKARDIQVGIEFRDWLITKIGEINTSDDASEDRKIDACNAIHELFQAFIEATEESTYYADAARAERDSRQQSGSGKKGGF